MINNKLKYIQRYRAALALITRHKNVAYITALKSPEGRTCLPDLMRHEASIYPLRLCGSIHPEQ